MPADKKPEAKYRLKDINCIEVSLVTEPAVPAAKIALVKSASPFSVRLDKSFEIVKVDDEKQIIYATALVAGEPDLQNDLITDPDDVEKAAHSLLINMGTGNQKGTGAGYMHKEFDQGQFLVESVYDADGSVCRAKGFPTEKCKAGSWIVAIHIVNKAKWQEVKDGTITGVSIGALANRIPLERGVRKGNIFKAVTGWFRKRDDCAEKAIDFDSSYALNQFYDQCPNMWDTLVSAFWSIMYDDQMTLAEKADAIDESLQQFSNRIRELLNITEKTIKELEIKLSGGDPPAAEGEIDMTQAELKAVIDEAVKGALHPVLDRIAKFEELVAKIAAIEKSVNEQQKIEESEPIKKLNDEIKKIVDVVDKLATRVVGSNALKSSSSEPPADPEKKDVAPSLLSSSKAL